MSTSFTDLLFDDLRVSSTCTVTGLVEMSRLDPAKREKLLLQHDGNAWPLLSQPEFENLRMIGPWAFGPGTRTSLDGQHQFYRNLSRQAGDAICGWITSELPLDQLALHLAGANIAYTPDGERYLLRYHTEVALPVLHEQRQQPGVRALFAPVTTWWYPLAHASRAAWKAVRGEKMLHAPAIAPITLDEHVWTALAGDPLAYVLADRLGKTIEAERPEANCYGIRLGVVQRSLAEARQRGLTRTGDLGDYVTFMVQQGHVPALDSDPHWTSAIEAAKSGGPSLAQAYRALRFKA
ncbi:DUF4123 domain-containing protein [Paraburkholderia tropica]|uniref:DUF4123 domain-containing protein n=1 Tax=Paraburkholderia tropica TaxID=92647 RepID=UPI002AAF9B88|nr:DUF4123 domain-containing protein [Paraburkholderia tropica]